jgi:RHS repeat-associated protein
MVIDQTGDLANMKRHDYLPFGEELVAPVSGRSAAQGYASGDSVRQQFTQKERDVETGLDYFEARHYSSMQGRFASADSIGGTRLDPQSLNLYSYVLNNPLALIDPDGHSSELPCNFGGTGPCIGTFQDPSNLPPAKKPGDPFPVASCLGCGSPFGKIADVDVFDYTPASTTSDVLATSVDLKPVLQTSALDYLPVYGSARQFLFNYTTHNFEGALLSFGHLALDLSPLGMIRRGGKAISLGIEYGPGAALRGTVLARQLGAEGEIAVRALYDIGEKSAIRIGGRLRFPDGLTDAALSEVKNVKSLSFTRQLRDYAAFAGQTGRRFDLYVRSSTRLSGPLRAARDAGLINIVPF